MKKLKIALFIAFCAIFAFGANVDIKDMRIAVIWTSSTYVNEEYTPSNWNDNDFEDWQIGLAQLKIVLSAIHDEIQSNGSLDTDGFDINFSHTGSTGFNNNPNLLKNVRVYKIEDKVSYEKIVNDFGGEHPNVICYINAGVSANANTGIYQLFQDAAEHNVGILLVGSESAFEATKIDPTRRIFPVMGVQTQFRMMLHDDDVINDFQFLTDNDHPDMKIPDTVYLTGDGDEQGEIRSKTRNGKLLWKRNWQSGIQHENFGTNDILYKYGEWSIKASAVEVVKLDYYPAEMNYGMHMEYNIYIAKKEGTSGNDNGGEVYILNDKSMSDLYVNGKLFKKKGARIDTHDTWPGLKNGELEKDWILWVENEENNNQQDEILILPKGYKPYELPAYAFVGEEKDNSDLWSIFGEGNTKYDDMWNNCNASNENRGGNSAIVAGGLRDLRIELDTTKSIYKKIFAGTGTKTHSHLSQKSGNEKIELKFRPWSKYGRLNADADLWAFNNQLKLASYDEISANTNFDTTKYYSDHLAQQKAGRAGQGYQQYVIPPSNSNEFSNMKHADELPAVTQGNGDLQRYYNDFKDKKFYTISAVQKGTRRLAIIGYQPTYLQDTEASKYILHDVITFIGFDNYTLPQPKVTIDEKVVENGKTDTLKNKTIDEAEVKITVDTKTMDDDMKKCTHKVHWEIWYRNDVTYTQQPDGVLLDSASVDLDMNNLQGEIFTLSLDNYNKEKLEINASEEWLTVKTWTKPECAPFMESRHTESKIYRSRQFNQLPAGLYDQNADGFADFISVAFDTLYSDDLPTKLKVTSPFSSAKTFEITLDGNENVSKDDQKHTYSITLTKEQSDIIGFGTEFNTGNFLTWSGNDGGFGTKAGQMEDKMAPVIISARLERQCEQPYNILKVEYSEALLSAAPKTGALFSLWKENSTAPTNITVTNGNNTSGNIWSYNVAKSGGGNVDPKIGEYGININSTLTPTKIQDAKGNEVTVANNKKVESKDFVIAGDCFKQIITPVPGGKLPNDKGDTITIIKDPKDPVVKEIITSGGGTIIVVDPGKNADIGNDTTYITGAAIFDKVGNLVAKKGEGDNKLVVSVEELIDGRKVAVIGWNNKNAAGRDVGSGTYLLIVESKAGTEKKPIRVDHPKSKK
ncbi:MAG: hypothetical protein FWF51_02380 [Chitinivibrionia bacterium]|nr:hypothetical protein [Chitinivibrionia bacterium]MCL1945986.1 hypothetical protein [Chitinivibrionia bacterium]